MLILAFGPSIFSWFGTKHLNHWGKSVSRGRTADCALLCGSRSCCLITRSYFIFTSRLQQDQAANAPPMVIIQRSWPRCGPCTEDKQQAANDSSGLVVYFLPYRLHQAGRRICPLITVLHNEEAGTCLSARLRPRSPRSVSFTSETTEACPPAGGSEVRSDEDLPPPLGSPPRRRAHQSASARRRCGPGVGGWLTAEMSCW